MAGMTIGRGLSGMLGGLLLGWGALAAADGGSAGVVLDDFNKPQLSSWWSTWADPESVKPTVKLAAGAVEGTGAMEITYPRTKVTAIVGRGGVKIPAGANALALWVRKVAGAPGCQIILEGDPRSSAGGNNCFIAPLAIPDSGEWTRLVIPFSSFRYGFTKKPPVDKNFDPGKVAVLNLSAGRRPESFTIQIDRIEFVTAPAAAPAQPAEKRN